MPDKKPDADVHARPFADALREFEKGRTHDDLTAGLHDVIAAVADTNKVGKIVLTIKVTPQASDTEMVSIETKLDVTLPEHARDKTLFYVDDDGNLTRKHPTQLEFESLREVPNTDTVKSIQGENLTSAKEKNA